MANPHGSFIWYELMTPDTAAATTFYTDVVGWTAGGFAGGSDVQDYTILSAGDRGVAGMMTSPVNGPAPGWFGYVGVDDVDAAVRRIENAGGAIHMPATDIQGVGRMAMTADPQGVVFYVMRGSSEEGSEAFSPDAIGACSWNELATTDLDPAIDFYSDQFGWVQSGSMPMGEMGDYKFLSHHDVPFGAAMTAGKDGPPPHWRFYFRVADIDGAADRLKSGGGTILHGPAEVPGGDRVIIATDPQGAIFGLVGK